ncbi:MAG: hypothetical protein ACXAD7_19335 [Candidatus Kariarchaeaceae archaeon]|jgi:hypothetical protein
MSIHYSISYLDTSSRGGFRFFGFKRAQQQNQCEKCKTDRAIVKMTNTDNRDDAINLCMLCYNKFSADELLGQ